MLSTSSLNSTQTLKHTCSDDDHNRVSKKICKRSFVNANIESRLLKCSGVVSTVCREDREEVQDAKKKDDAPVPVELWLYWLNAGIRTCLTLKEWNQHVTVIQEQFLLVIWKRNVARNFSR